MPTHLDAAALAHRADPAAIWRYIAMERRAAGLEGAAQDAERHARDAEHGGTGGHDPCPKCHCTRREDGKCWYCGRVCERCGEPMEYENIPDERHLTGVRAWSGWYCSNGHEVEDEPRSNDDA